MTKEQLKVDSTKILKQKTVMDFFKMMMTMVLVYVLFQRTTDGLPALPIFLAPEEKSPTIAGNQTSQLQNVKNNNDEMTNNTISNEKQIPLQLKTQVLFTNVKDVCLLLNISSQDCKCERSKVVCDLEQMSNNVGTTTVVTVKKINLSRIYASISILTSILGIFGNTAVLLVSYKDRRTLPLYKKHIAVLAVIDFIFSIVQVIDVARLFWKIEWIYGLALCKILRSSLLLGNLLSIGFITMIAVERYFGIVEPLKRRTKRINILSVIHTVVAIATVVPYAMSLQVVPESKRCEELWSHGQNASLVYQWYLAIVYFILPVCMIVHLYRTIIKHLLCNRDTDAILVMKMQQKKRIDDNRRIMFILISIMVAFVVFTLPNRVLWIYSVATNYKYISSNMYFVLLFISYLTYPFHICINPIIYSVIDKRWRKELFGIIFNRKVRSLFQKTKASENMLFSMSPYANNRISSSVTIGSPNPCKV